MASSMIKSGSRLGSRALASAAKEMAPKAVTTAGLHTSSQTMTDKWKIPERLLEIPTAENPQFFNMVEYYFHKACVLAEERLIGQVNRHFGTLVCPRLTHSICVSIVVQDENQRRRQKEQGPRNLVHHRALLARSGGDTAPPKRQWTVRNDHR